MDRHSTVSACKSLLEQTGQPGLYSPAATKGTGQEVDIQTLTRSTADETIFNPKQNRVPTTARPMPPLLTPDRPVHVFVSPNTLTFISQDYSSHKQVLTLYNPYDFKFKYKVLCTAQTKYTMLESEGIV